MKQISPTSPLVFVHVMKTAGIAVREAITSNFRDQECVGIYESFGDPDRIYEGIKSGFNNGALFYSGHFTGEDVCSIMPSFGMTPIIMTICRDPRERIFSLYHYICAHPNDPLHEFAISHSFESFCYGLIEEKASLISNHFYLQTAPYENRQQTSEPIGYLHRYWFVGTTFQLGAFAAAASEDFGLSITVGRANVTESKPYLVASVELNSYLRSINYLDYLIYETVATTGPIWNRERVRIDLNLT